jgi:hypothetical protein
VPASASASAAAPRLHVRARARPTASFAHDHALLSSLREESASVQLTGRAPWQLRVAYTPPPAADVDGDSDGPHTQANAKANATGTPTTLVLNVTAHTQAATAVPLAVPGSYRLLGVSDAFCTGAVVEPAVVLATWAPHPTARWDLTAAPAAVCLGAPAVGLPIALTGRGPWQLSYAETVRAFVYLCLCLCKSACVALSVYVSVCVCVCGWVGGWVFPKELTDEECAWPLLYVGFGQCGSL